MLALAIAYEIQCRFTAPPLTLGNAGGIIGRSERPPGCQMDQNRVKTQFGFRRAHQIAGIMIPTTNIMTKNSAIFQPHVTGAIAAIAIPNPTMQARTIASFPPLIRASSFSRRSALWRVCNGGLFSANGAAPKGTEWQESLAATLPRSPPGEIEEQAWYLQKAHLTLRRSPALAAGGVSPSAWPCVCWPGWSCSL